MKISSESEKVSLRRLGLRFSAAETPKQRLKILAMRNLRKFLPCGAPSHHLLKTHAIMSQEYSNEIDDSQLHALLQDKELPSAMELERLLYQVSEVFANEDNVIQINSKTSDGLIVIGDLHGQFYDVARLMDIITNKESENIQFLFLVIPQLTPRETLLTGDAIAC